MSPLLVAAVVLLAVAASKKKKPTGAAATEPESKPTKQQASSGGKQLAKAPPEFCDFFLVRRVNDETIVPTASSGSVLSLGKFKWDERSFALAKGGSAAQSIHDPFGGAPGFWNVEATCPSGSFTVGAVRTFP